MTSPALDKDKVALLLTPLWGTSLASHCDHYTVHCCSHFSLQLNTTQNYTDVCPVLTPPPTSDSGGYVWPVVVDTDLMVYGINLPPTSFFLSDVAGSGSVGLVEQNETIQYKCRFGTTVAPAQRYNSSVVMCIMNMGQVRMREKFLILVLFFPFHSLSVSPSLAFFLQLTLSPGAGSDTRSLQLVLVNPSMGAYYTLDTSTGGTVTGEEGRAFTV